MKKIKNSKQGFTLIELLVVVLIIGILAGIALPQYKMAVTKAKVASILPIMRRWKDALMEYKLKYGEYYSEDDDILDASWPSDWGCGSNRFCSKDFWDECIANEDQGNVYCLHIINDGNLFYIIMNQPDSSYEGIAGMTICEAEGTEGNKVCKALGGKLLEGVDGNYGGDSIYKLN